MTKATARLQAVPSIKDGKGPDTKDKASAIVEGRKKSEAAEAYLLERIDNAQRLETFLKRFDFETLVRLEDGIKTIKDLKRRQAEEERKAEEEREKVAQQIREMAAKAGIDLELKGVKEAKRRTADPERYAVKFKDTGDIFYWSGHGHAPKAFKYAMKEKGYKKEDLLNPKTGKFFEIAKAPK